MKRSERPPSLLRDALSLLWVVPLAGVPFAGFFLLVSSQPLKAFPSFYLVSCIFSFFTMSGTVVTRHFLAPMLATRLVDKPQAATIYNSLLYVVTGLFATAAAAIVLNATLVPGLLGNVRTIATLLTYTLLFGALFAGTAIAWHLFQRAVDRAGSERELQLARRIQRSFLLSEFPQRSRLEVHAVNVSSKEVSGDFYDVVPVGDDSILLAIADVSGKGVPAAILSSMLQASLRTQAGQVASPAAMMTVINHLACQRSSTGQFATFFLAAIHEPTLTLRFTNAGHNFPVLLRADGERVLLETGGLVVGMMEGMPYEEQAVVLAPGDRVLFYTDGVSEAANADGEMLGEDRLYALLDELSPTLTAEQVVEAVLAGVRAFLGEAEAGDDITVMALRVLPGASTRKD